MDVEQKCLLYICFQFLVGDNNLHIFLFAVVGKIYKKTLG